MKKAHAYLSLGLILCLYLAALVWADAQNNWAAQIDVVLPMLPMLMGFSLLSYVLRYIRWHWLMLRVGHSLQWPHGFLAYLSGFAFTATPGKVGELIRIKYFAPQGVSAWRVLAAFVFERACDLIAVLILATLAINDQRLFLVALLFVASFVTIVGVFAYRPAWLTRIAGYLRLYSFKKFAGLLLVLRNGLTGCCVWLTPLDLLVSLAIGLLAWSITSMGLVLLLSFLGFGLPVSTAIAIYPLAMLAGAASMLPGGIGSTEATLVFLLSQHDVTLPAATLAAVCIRFTSMWFAVFCGLLAMGLVSSRRSR